MTEVVVLVAAPLLLLTALVWTMRREDRRLRRRARRYRQLEFEGVEQLRRDDPYPESRIVAGAFLREPDGRAADADRVLHEELERAREHTRRAQRRRAHARARRRGKGPECLV